MPLEIRPVAGFDELHRWVATRNAASSDAMMAEMRALVRARELDSVDLLALEDGEPVGIAFLSGDPRSLDIRRPWFDVRVPPEHRRRGVGSALLADVTERARSAGHVGLRCSAHADDSDSLAFLHRRGFTVTHNIEQVSLELGEATPVHSQPPENVALVRLADTPELVAAMYALAVSTAADRTDRLAGIVPTETDWRTYELSSPLVRLDMTAVAIADGEAVGYSIIQDFPGYDALLHRTLVIAPIWREQGLAHALVNAGMDDARAAGVPLLIAMPENEFEADVFASLGYRLRERWLEHDCPL